jgi:hypothetical protein
LRLKSGNGNSPNPLPLMVKVMSAPFPVIAARIGPPPGPIGAVLSAKPVMHFCPALDHY